MGNSSEQTDHSYCPHGVDTRNPPSAYKWSQCRSALVATKQRDLCKFITPAIISCCKIQGLRENAQMTSRSWPPSWTSAWGYEAGHQSSAPQSHRAPCLSCLTHVPPRMQMVSLLLHLISQNVTFAKNEHFFKKKKNQYSQEFPGGNVMRIPSTLPHKGERVWSLVGELRFCKPWHGKKN